MLEAYLAGIDYSQLNHPLRIPLAAEIHSRPFLQLRTPENLTHFALFLEQTATASSTPHDVQHRILRDLCTHYGVPGPQSQARYFFHDFGRFRLKWECHTEFATYTFVERRETPVDRRNAYEHMPLEHVPKEWLAGLRGKLIVAAHIVLDALDNTAPPDREPTDIADLRQHFEGKMLVGSHAGNGGIVLTDFLVQPDGFSRFFVRDIHLREFQAGRLVGRLCEIETYRMMALLGLPQAEMTQPLLSAIEQELAALTIAMEQSDRVAGYAHPGAHTGHEDQNLLHRITDLAARVEKLSINNNYRFSASQAYFNLVQARIRELREERMEGIPTLAEFMGRRLTPAMNTCLSVSQRQEALAVRIARSNDLLRTRVGIEQERQNRNILQSLNARAAQQLKMQQAVEGLSVVALSYYLLGLIGYLVKALKAAHVPIDPDILTGAMAPLVALGVWRTIGRLHKTFKSEDSVSKKPGHAV